jgi:hypothetical protein
MPSLILKTRLKMLSSNLSSVATVMDLAGARGQQIQFVQQSLFGPDSVSTAASDLRKSVKIAIKWLDDDDLKQQAEVANAFATIKDANERVLVKLMAHLDESRTALEALLGSRVELGSRRIEQLLPEKTGPSIRAIESRLAKPAPDPTDWEFEKELTTQSDPLFAEYVDLLRGLALRESGIELGICELADRLLEGCDRVAGAPWKSVAIPSSRGPSELTPAQIIRLGFPEWTIWALPLAAYEFGRLMVSQDDALKLNLKIKDEASARQMSIATLADSMADAFATYAVGPAYACAAVLMRLNPRPADPGGPPVDDARAQMIFSVLKIADEKADSGTTFEPLRLRLEQAWAEALAETTAKSGDGKTAEELARVFWTWAETNYVTARYQPSSWTIAERLKDVLAKRLASAPLSADDQAAMAAGAGDIRDTLNAAWPLRLEEPDKTENIAAEALAVWKETNARRQKATQLAGRVAVQPGVQRGRS